MRPIEQHRFGVDELKTYDQWLAWEHGLRLRRARAAEAASQPKIAPRDLDWGDQALITASLKVVAPFAADLVAYFYDCLFADQPRLRALFPDDMSNQRERLLAALLSLVQDVDDPDDLIERLQQLGRDHRKFGARAAHYASVGKALITALSRFAGDAWTPEIQQAWLARYTVAAEAMMAAADADLQPPYWYGNVVSHERVGHDLAIIRIQPRQPYPYSAGQWATLISERLRRIWRPYVMATAPADSGELEFHVRATGAGGLSDFLVNATSPGDTLRVGGPQGTAQLRPVNGRIQVFVEHGLGWAPTRALLDELGRRTVDTSHRTVLLHVGDGAPYDPRWADVCDRCPGLSTVAIRSVDEAQSYLSQVDSARLEVYVSGGDDFTSAMTQRLGATGVPARHTVVTSWPGA